MAQATQATYDSGWLMKAAGLIAASAAVATVIDCGSSTVKVKGDLIIDVSALEIASNDEIYDIVLQGSTVAAFATDTAIRDLCSLTLAAAEVQRTDANGDSVVGRYVLPFSNESAGTTYRYLRIYTVVAGTIATGINYTVHAAPCSDV